ncbi:MAG: WYL domain-containing protein [Bacteroidaceae bacterium]|jgi:hypothetical protein|nr:WYL domain-containing protein [Bacteroidaceae bacterium]
MKAYALFQQYIWLVNTIHRAGKITLKDINRKWLETELSEGVSIARSTFNRHKDAIQDMFGIYIDCDKKDGFSYYIGNKEVLEEDSIQNWMLSTLSVNFVLSESKAVADRILLETIPSSGEDLQNFIEAMKRKVRITVRYQRYAVEYETSMKVEPYCVKLFNRRWYGLVRSLKNGDYFLLAFDRIKELELTDEKFSPDESFDASHWFRHSYGIVRDPEVGIQRILIRAFGNEAYYMRDLPMHHTQKEIDKTPEYSDFELTLSPTADFLSPLLSRGSAIKVLEPQWLADEIQNIHLQAAKLYD